MTPKEKGEELVERFRLNVLDYEGCSINSHISKQCALIAEDFAKEVLRVYIGNKTLQYKQNQGDYSLDELLLIIKKEKGL